MSMAAAEPLRPALVASALLHAALLGLAIFVGAHSAADHAKSTLEGGASWAGETLDIDGLVAARAAVAPAVEPAAPAAPEPETKPPVVADTSGAEAAPAPKPRVHHKRAEPKPEPSAGAAATPPKPAPGASAAAAASSEGNASSADAPTPNAGTSGAVPGVANLAKAFTKAVTAATSRDPLWDELPLGVVGSVRVAIDVDDEGHISSSALDDREHVSEPLRRLVERTLLLLQAGRFAIDKGDLHAGSQKLRILVSLSAGEPADDYDDPHHVVSLGFDPPTPSAPGKAYFVHASGRRFEAKIWIDAGA